MKCHQSGETFENYPDEHVSRTPDLIVALLKRMDRPKSSSEERLHGRCFPVNFSEVAVAKTTMIQDKDHSGGASSVWREQRRSWTTSMLSKLVCQSGLTSK